MPGLNVITRMVQGVVACGEGLLLGAAASLGLALYLLVNERRKEARGVQGQAADRREVRETSEV